MPDIMRLEDGEKERDEIANSQQTALDHAWDWWKYHAEQRIALVRFYIISLGGIAAAIGFLYQQKEQVLTAILSIFGAFLSYCFLRLDTRTGDLVKVGEAALAHEHQRMALTTNSTAIHLCAVADNQKKHWPYSYGEIISLVLGAIIAMFILMALFSLHVVPRFSI